MQKENYSPPVDLYLNFEKSSWKNQVRRTGFLACKNQFRNLFLQATQAVKIQFEIPRLKIQFVKLDFSELNFQKSSPDQQGVSVSQFITKKCSKLAHNYSLLVQD